MTPRSLTVLIAAFAVAGCNKKPPAPAVVPPPPPAPPTQPAAAATERIDPRNTNQGGGALVGSYRAGLRTNLLNDMSQLGQFVEIQFTETGKMPDAAAIKANLTTAHNIMKEINDGFIILTGTKDHAGLWAYEVDSDKIGGVGLVAGKAQRMQADEIKQMLGKK